MNKKQDNSNLSNYVIQHLTKQDFATTGSTENFEYMIVADSHGGFKKRGLHKHWFVSTFKSIDWSSLLSKINWIDILMKLCNTRLTKDIGSTFTCIKITATNFEISWIGDSTAKIYNKENGELVWQTNDHNYDNKNDIDTIKKYRKCVIKDDWDIQATSSDKMTSKRAKTFNYTKELEIMNMTRSLGHCGCFCWKNEQVDMQFETVIVPRKDMVKYKIVAGSDGFWQVMSPDEENLIIDHNAEFLATRAREKWAQPWDHDNTKEIIKDIKIPRHNWDDIAVATWFS